MLYKNLDICGKSPKGGILWTSEEISEFVTKFSANNARDLSDKKYKIISLGDCCFTRQMLTWMGIKPSKENGELTHPFDLSANSLSNIADCIYNDFRYFCDPEHIKNNTHTIYGGSYPHDDMDFAENDSVKFRIKYLRRISNFYEDIYYSKSTVFFINVNDARGEELINCAEKMIVTLYTKFPNINYKFIMVNGVGEKPPIIFDGEKNIYINCDKPYQDYKWHENRHQHTDAGIEYSCEFSLKIKEVLKKYA
jgi:hypothetical protein